MDSSRAAAKMLWTSSTQVASVLQAMAEAKHAEAKRIGQLIASLRDRQGWSQEDLAQEVGVSTSTISRWERGLHKGYGPNIRKLAESLGVEPAVLTPADDLMLGSQLDRIELKLDRILGAMGVEGDADEVADVVDETVRGVQTAASPPKRTAARSGTRPAA